MSVPLRIATRGSLLARWQASYIAGLLGVPTELVVVDTTGDKRRDLPIDQIGGQGVFVKEVQNAVLTGQADIAVHSAKDLPASTPDGLVICAVPERGDPRDALVGSSLEELPIGAVVGTGAVRRRAQLAHARPDLQFAGLRGNVDTRLAKASEFDAIVVAYAPLIRLERDDVTAHILSPSVVLPQVGQGALAVECRAEDVVTATSLRAIEHHNSRRCLDAERSFLARLGGSCDLPVGAYGVVTETGKVHLRTMLASFDGRVVLNAEDIGDDEAALGARLAAQLLDEPGGAELLGAPRR